MASLPLRPDLSSKASRLPPPSLFQGPPSRNASALSLAQDSAITGPETSRHGDPNTASNMGLLNPSTAASRSGRFRRPSTGIAQQSETDRAEAMWIEMQNTLAEVELSAENTTHVFGHEHSKALEELRTAQLALAQAWARSEGEDGSGGDTRRDDEKTKIKEGGAKINDTGVTTDQGAAEVSGGGPAKIGPANAAAAIMRDDLSAEEESQKDILMARKRREANDKYFQRVNEGVLDVVAKLEEVALAIRKVEKESRDIWSETESTASTEDLSAG